MLISRFFLNLIVHISLFFLGRRNDTITSRQTDIVERAVVESSHAGAVDEGGFTYPSGYSSPITG